MNTLPILSWDPINYQDNLMVSVYIQPSLEILELIQASGASNCDVIVVGTQTESYDNRHTYASVSSSSPSLDGVVSGAGPYLLILDLPWDGYPLHNGRVVFPGLPVHQQAAGAPVHPPQAFEGAVHPTQAFGGPVAGVSPCFNKKNYVVEMAVIGLIIALILMLQK